MSNHRKVCIVGGKRIPFTKSFTHYFQSSNQDLATAALKALVEAYQLQNKILGDVALGAVIIRSNDWNIAREVVLGSGLHPRTPAYNVQRACGTGLETILQISHRIQLGLIDWGIGGGVDSNSEAPLMLSRQGSRLMMELSAAKSLGDKIKILTKFRPKDILPAPPVVQEPRTGLSMGEHCELMVKDWNIAREDQDLLAFESHQKAAQAYADYFYDDLLTPFQGLKTDTLVRSDTTLEKLAKLKPVFDRSAKGTLTAGNSTPLTEGASAVLLCSEEKARTEGYKPLAYLVDSQVSALDFVGGEGLLMAPALAVGQLMHRNNLTWKDLDFIEIHEAFAGQVLCTFKAWEDEEYCQKTYGFASLGKVPREKLNVKGGSLALGHPFAATGGRIVASLAKMLHQKGPGSKGLISICTAGGMGVAALVQGM